MNTTEALHFLIEMLLALVAGAPLVVIGLRKSSDSARWKLVGAGGLVVLATDLATCSNSIFGIRLPGGWQWNWSGKVACVVVIALCFAILPSGTLRRSGIVSLPRSGSARAVIVFFVLCFLVGLAAGVPSASEADAESLAYQLVMLSLAEEPVYRGILPALFSAALGSPWKLAGVQLGWWWLISGMLFGLGHAITWSTQGYPEFQATPFVITALVGLAFGWLAARSGSLWPCVICHSLIDSTGLAIAMLLN